MFFTVIEPVTGVWGYARETRCVLDLELKVFIEFTASTVRWEDSN